MTTGGLPWLAVAATGTGVLAGLAGLVVALVPAPRVPAPATHPVAA